MKIYKTGYKNFRKILFVFIAIAVLSSVFFLIFTSVKSYADARESIISLEKNTIEKTAQDLNTTLEQSAMINSALLSFIESNITDLQNEDASIYKNLQNQIQLSAATYDFVSGVQIKNNLLDIKSGSAYDGNLSEYSPLGTVKGCVLYCVNQENRPWLILQSKDDFLNSTVTVTIDPYYLGEKIFYEYNPLQLKYIVNESGTVVSSNRMENLGKNIKNLFSLEAKADMFTECEIDGKQAYFSSKLTNNYRLYCVLVTYRDVYANFLQFTPQLIAFYVIFILGMLLAAGFATWFIYRPIGKLINLARDFFPVPLINNFDELEYIRKCIINQQEENKSLSENINETISSLRQQEVLALQSQISPHFILNMLDAINWIAVAKFKGKNEVSFCAEQTAYLFKYGMDISTTFDTVKNELMIAEKSLSVLNVRYRADVKLVYDIPEELMEERIIKICFQPIIENAMSHGFSNYKNDGVISIKASIEDGKLHVVIEDNGRGMSSEEREALLAKINDFSLKRSNHIGLWNINYRMNLLFGSDYKIEIESEKNKGTKFILDFPVIKF